MSAPTVEVRRVEHGHQRREWVLAPPPGARLVSGPVRLVDEDTGALVAAVGTLESAPDGVRGGIRGVEWLGPKNRTSDAGEFRLSGFTYLHRNFGFSPPVPMRRRYGAARCVVDVEHPDLAVRLEQLGRDLAGVCSELAPDQWADSASVASDKILPEWRLPGVPWTSGIINRTAALPYHRDAGNLRGVWSAMVVLRRDVAGGHLHVPDYDVYVGCEDLSVVYFPGYSLLHGVTPFTPTGARPERHSIVYYAKQQMAKALPYAQELERARRLRTEAEDRIASAVHDRG